MEPRDFRTAMGAAERAAASGDYVSTERLLTTAARLQEQELGPGHPELAVTINNLAIVCERIGKLDDAEAHYRRAAEIAAAALPADDPAVETSRRNLEDFIRARAARPVAAAPEPPGRLGLADEAAPEAPTAVSKPPTPGARARQATEPAAPRPPADRTAGTPRLTIAADAPAGAPSPAPPRSRRDRPAAEPRHPAAPTAAAPSSRRWPLIVGIGVLVVVALLLALRSWSGSASSESPIPTPDPAAGPATPGDAPPRTPDSGAGSTGGRTPDAPPVRARTDGSGTPEEGAGGGAAASEPGEGARAGTEAAAANVAVREASGVSLVQAEVCSRFAPRGGRWRCDPVGTETEPGSLAFYTRVKSPRTTRIEHRWYQDDKLRQTVTLTIRANPGAGYRTYSRQRVRGDASTWRVEARTTDGTLLHEQRFVVK